MSDTNFNHILIKGFNERNTELATVVFVDYESMFWSLYNIYGETPKLDVFYEDIKKRGRLIDKIKIFGDFSKPEMKDELSKIRTITNDITNCESTNSETKKDYTDFIMLDHVYQMIITQPTIEQYILVTGDGHFHSVATFLRTFNEKVVGAYGVKGSLSSQLVNCSSWAVEISPQSDIYNQYINKILDTIQWAERNNIIPTFKKSVEVAARYHKGERVKFASALSKLIEEGYIEQKETLSDKGVNLNALFPKWALINKHGLLNLNN
ncbi:MAG TPA: NYN domain-containing protein [Desulfotomaculum sp.]|nr:MAG: hypothetical protein JL56_02565 [Desulfotomaculum sp. BICA1-6]HBX22584.1 NYN domain-containing protein [Desulfotomaculum sp.]